MAQTGFTPISLYYTATAAATPTAGNLVAGELAINTNDGKLFYKDSAGVVQTIASKDTNSGTFTNISVSGVASFADGTVSLPSITNIGDTNTGIFFPAADTIAFAEGGVESMRIDSSGQVGIGTSSPSNKLTVVGAEAFRAVDDIAFLSFYNSANSTRSGYLQMQSAGVSSLVVQANQPLAFNTNNTERMRIDSSGNVGIGTSSPSYKLDVNGPAQASGIRLKYIAGGTSGFAASTTFTQVEDTTNTRTYICGPDASTYGAYSEYIATSTGSPAVARTVTNTTLTWATNNAERMRIDSSGNVLVGTTSTTGRLSIVTQGDTSGTFGVYVKNSSSTDMFLVRNDGGVCTGVAGASPYNNTSASAANCGVASDGYLFRSTSSIKYKTDVQDATHGLAEVMQLRPVTYKGKTDGDTVFGGLIAEEVHEAGLTEFVQYAEDGSPDALAYGNMVSLLSKAIQEQQAMIETLTTRLNALEGK